MKHLIGLALIATSAVACASSAIKFDVFSGKEKIGDGVYLASVTPQSKTSTLTITIGERRIGQTNIVDQYGQQVKVEVHVVKSESLIEKNVATFDVKGNATYERSANGHNFKKVFPLGRKGTRKDASEYWFIRNRPAAMTWSQYYTFSISSRKWQLAKTTYMGKKAVQVGAKKVNANLVVQVEPGDKLTMWLDDKGDPLIIDTGAIRMVRHW